MDATTIRNARLFDAVAKSSAEAFEAKLAGATADELNYRGGSFPYGSFAGRTVLMEVVKHHDWPGIVGKMLDRGFHLGGDIDARDLYDQTALHLAGIYMRPASARVLLERGADRTLKHKGGATPVALAVNQAEWAKGAAKPAVVLPPGARYHLGKIICAHLESKTPDPDGAPKKRARASFAEPAPKPHFSLP